MMTDKYEQIVVYLPRGIRQKIKEFSFKYQIPMSQFALYSTLEMMEKIEAEKNVDIFELRKRIREKIYGYYYKLQEREVVQK